MTISMTPEFSRLISYISDKMTPRNQEEQALKDYIKMVLRMAQKYIRPGVEYEDLITAGMMGIVEASRTFDPQRSNNFGAHAVLRIRGSLYDYFIKNLTALTVPIHVSKTRVYIEKMYGRLTKEPVLFSENVLPWEVIQCRKHAIEEKLSLDCKTQVQDMKAKVERIAINSKTNYEKLVYLAHRGTTVEAFDDSDEVFLFDQSLEDIEDCAQVFELAEDLMDVMGEKKTAVLFLHHHGLNNEDIAKELSRVSITKRRISRQAVRMLLKSAKEKAQEHAIPEVDTAADNE